jgi:hypothetical protein
VCAPMITSFSLLSDGVLGGFCGLQPAFYGILECAKSSVLSGFCIIKALWEDASYVKGVWSDGNGGWWRSRWAGMLGEWDLCCSEW